MSREGKATKGGGRGKGLEQGKRNQSKLQTTVFSDTINVWQSQAFFHLAVGSCIMNPSDQCQ